MQAKRRHLRRSLWLLGVLAILVGFGVDFAGFVLVANEKQLAASAANLIPPPVRAPTPSMVEQPYVSATPAPYLPTARPQPELVAVPTPPVVATPVAPLQAERPLIEPSDSSGNAEGRGLVVPGAVISIGLLAWAWLRRTPRIGFKKGSVGMTNWPPQSKIEFSDNHWLRFPFGQVRWIIEVGRMHDESSACHNACGSKF